MPSSEEEINLRLNGLDDAQRELNDVARGAARTARITDQLARSFDHLEDEANQTQRALDRVNDELRDNGPSEELNAELARLQRRLQDIGNDRRIAENLQAQFRRSSEAAGHLDRQLADVRRELDRLNREYADGGDPAVLRNIREQQRALDQLNSQRRRIASDDEQNQTRLANLAEEARRVQARREDEDRRRREDEDNSSWVRRLSRRVGGLGDGAGNGLQSASLPGPAATVGAAYGAAAAIPLLAALGGALTGAVGAGVAGAGIAGAIMGDPERFKAAWGDATDTVKEEFLGATKVFTGPTLDAIKSVGPLVESWHLGDIFGDAAKFVPTITHGVEGFASGIVRGVAAMVDKGGPAVEGLSSGFAELGNAAGDAFESIADGAEGGGEALRDLLFVTGDVVRGLGTIIGAAGELYGYLHDHPLEAAIFSGGLSVPLSYLDSMSDKSKEVIGTITDLGETGAAAFYGLDQRERDTLATVERLNSAFDDTRNTLLGVSGAAIAVEQDFDDLAAGFKRGADALDITTQKGRDNRELINSTIQDLLRQRDAAIAAGGGTQAAYDQANAAYNTQLHNLEDLLVKLGLTRTAAHNMMNEFYDKTVTVTVKVKQVGNVTTEGVISGGDPRRSTGSAYAGGGEVSQTGFSLVGEQGPEMRFMNKGDYVATAAQTKALLGGNSGSYAPVFNLSLTVNAGIGTDGYQVGKQVADALRAFVEPSGGDLQQAVMRRSGG